MQMPETTKPATTGKCWENPMRPSAVLLQGLKSGSIAESLSLGEKQLAARLAALRRETLDKPVIFVGAGTCGLGAGAGKTLAAVREWTLQKKLDADIVEVGCIGLCSEEPIVDIQLPGKARISFGGVSVEKVDDLLESVLSRNSVPADNVLGQFRNHGAEPWAEVPYLDEHPFLASQRRVVLAASGIIDPCNIDESIACGGYSAMAAVYTGMTREEVCNLVEASSLRGRGGGGFPTGRKWRFALNTASDQKYLICNADEGDPGAFMDRAVCESDPHRLIEGILIGAYAIGASKAYIYIRAEYPLAIKRLTEALAQASERGLLGHNILDSGMNLEIVIKMGAGAFVCGEETALMHSVEGKRGMPRPRPPFPAVRGLFDKPTIINNVETLANISLIIQRGAEWFASMGTEGSKGTKVFALSGMVHRAGLVEVPMGTPLREVVFDIGGGIPNNKRCKAVQIGGPSGGCIPEAHLDIPTDYEALKDFGAIVGSGGLVVIDESTCMVDFAKFFMEFIQSESCGKCIPCREGTKRMLEILQAITRPRRREDELDPLLRFQGIMRLKSLAETIKSTSLCGLGQTAPNPVLSTLRWFRDEYEAHIFERRCPAGACTELVGVACQNSCPVGTETWRYVAHIAQGEYTEAYKAIRLANPLPSVCARVCHHPCEQVCRAGTTGGEPIAIRALKRFVTESVDPATIAPEVPSAGSDAARVAVIGAGPSGLAAAHDLSLLGHKVTVFDRESEPGGMLVSAIPAYRLPRDVLKKEIAALLNDNVELKCNTTLGSDITIDGLFDEGYKAVYLATGAHQSRKLNLDGEDAEGVVPGMKFLKAHNLEDIQLAVGRVGIIGGGNSAVDAARVALRQKGVESVCVLYRRTRLEMPAYHEEIEAGLEEGLEIHELVAPVALHIKDGKLTGARLTRNKLGQPDASGRRRPEPVPGSEFDLELDTLIVAISEQPETGQLEQLALTKWGTLAVNAETHATARAGVFGGGDVATGPGTAIEAIGAGKAAAMIINRYVKNMPLNVLPKVHLPSVYLDPLPISGDDEEEAAARVVTPLLPVDKRKNCFAEVELPLSEEAALCEARRCLRCDLDFTQPD